MHNARIRTSGAWVFASTILETELEDLDQAQFESINGDQGGVWAPLSVIEIGGAGVKITDQLEIAAGTGSLLVNGTATFNDDVSFNNGTAEFNNGILNNGSYLGGAAVFNGAVQFNDVVAFSGGDVSLTGSYGLALANGHLVLNGGNLQIVAGSMEITAGNLDIGGNLDVGGTLDVTGGAFFGALTAAGTATFNGQVNANDPIVLGGDGHVRHRSVSGTDADGTYNVSTADTVYIAAGTLTANRTYTIGNTGAGNGSRMLIASQHTGSETVTVRRADTTSLGVVGVNTGQYRWMLLEYIGGQWVRVASDTVV